MASAPQPARTRNGVSTRASIEKEALRLFAQKGVEGTTIRDLALAVGVADAALYRYFTSKEDIAAELFATHYGALARSIEEIGAREAPFADTVAALVDLLCGLFDDAPDVFSFILLNQHAHLRYVRDDANAVEALRKIMLNAHAQGDIAIEDSDLAAAMALGAVLQPCVFKLYGRLPGAMRAHAPQLARAALRVLEASSRTS
jgi:AcrR family transcriptional regulator